jgi:hypothetical protein
MLLSLSAYCWLLRAVVFCALLSRLRNAQRSLGGGMAAAHSGMESVGKGCVAVWHKCICEKEEIHRELSSDIDVWSSPSPSDYSCPRPCLRLTPLLSSTKARFAVIAMCENRQFRSRPWMRRIPRYRDGVWTRIQTERHDGEQRSVQPGVTENTES